MSRSRARWDDEEAFFALRGVLERFRGQLSAILEAVGKVSELDLEGVPPTSHPLDLVNVLAEDEPQASLTREEALANAPDPEGGFFGVPPV